MNFSGYTILMSHIARSSLIIATFFALDKVLGFLRQVLFNRQFSAAERDVFFVSNNIPDLLSALISGGALGIALIPVLSQFLERDGRKAAWDLFARIVNLAFLVTAAFSLVVILLADPLVRYVIAPGFNDPQKWALVASLMRLDLGAILIFSISGLVMAGLQANQHFLLPAMAPGFYNLGQIFGITVLGPRFGIYGLAYGVILGALLHLSIQLPGLLRFGFRWAPAINLRHPGVQQVLRLMGPRVLTMLCLQSYFLARDRLASFFEEGAVSALNNGWFIQQVPETLIGTAIAIALLPSLAEHFVRGEASEFGQTVNRALRAMLALTVPIAALLAVSIRPLVQIAFNFEAGETELVVWATRAFLLGLTGHAWLEVAVRSFYAHQDARTPLLAAFLQAISYFLLAVILSRTVGHTGLALADTFTFTAQALLLLFLLNKRYPGALAMRSTLLRALLGALAGGAVTYALLRFAPLPLLPLALVSLAAGGLVSLPFIWSEVKSLVKL
jgi:putative peptidoglycan lipid II flippase